MAYIGAKPVNGFFEKQDLTTDGSTTTFTLNTAVGSSSSILVSVGGVIQEPEVAYNLGGGGTTIIFTEAPASTADTYIHYLGQAIVQNLSDVNGTELILDVDADTSLTADTDDQIDIKVGGADRSSIKTTGFHNIDSFKFVAGTGDDLQIYHDGSNSFIANSTGILKIATETSGIAVTIGHSTSEVTVADNMTVAGDLTVTGTANFGDTNITNVGSITLDTIANDGSDGVTIDSSTDVIIDAGGADIILKDDGTEFGRFTNNSTDFEIKVSTQDKDIKFIGDDGGSAITALSLDMSEAGAATFNNKIVATELDISGDVDVDGTLEADAITVDGTTLAEFISDTTGAMVSSNTETGITVSYDDSDNTLDFALAAAQTTITSLLATDIKIGEDDQTKIDFETADEIHFYANNVEQVYLGDNIFGPQSDSDVDLGSNSVRWKDAYIDTITSTSTITTGAGIVIADAGNIGSASDTDAIAIASNGQVTLTQTLIGTALDISGDIDVDGTANLDVVDIDGAVDMASTLGVTGVVTANAGVVIDNITIDGTEIDLSSGDLTLDVAGDIILDADGADIKFSDDGTHYASISNSSSDVLLTSIVSDKDIKFNGNDGGSGITALTLDMSAAGAATFNNDVTAFSDKRLKDNIETIPNALDKVCAMRGVTFTRNDNNDQPGTGVIAQEMQEVFPVVVKENKDDLNTLSVSYGNLVGVLIEAIKELKEEVEKLKKDS
jgi:cytoskeletal protein CcmA (bactofilin family)